MRGRRRWNKRPSRKRPRRETPRQKKLRLQGYRNNRIHKRLCEVLKTLNPFLRLKFMGTFEGKENVVHQVRWWRREIDFREKIFCCDACIKTDIYRGGRIEIDAEKEEPPYWTMFEEV